MAEVCFFFSLLLLQLTNYSNSIYIHFIKNSIFSSTKLKKKQQFLIFKFLINFFSCFFFLFLWKFSFFFSSFFSFFFYLKKSLCFLYNKINSFSWSSLYIFFWLLSKLNSVSFLFACFFLLSFFLSFFFPFLFLFFLFSPESQKKSQN